MAIEIENARARGATLAEIEQIRRRHRAIRRAERAARARAAVSNLMRYRNPAGEPLFRNRAEASMALRRMQRLMIAGAPDPGEA